MDGVDEFLPSEMRYGLTIELVGQTGVVSQAGDRVAHISLSDLISLGSSRHWDKRPGRLDSLGDTYTLPAIQTLYSR
jgi:hypothetical protein